MDKRRNKHGGRTEKGTGWDEWRNEEGGQTEKTILLVSYIIHQCNTFLNIAKLSPKCD